MATTVTISPGQLGAFIKRSVGKHAAAVQKGVRNAAIRSVGVLQKKTPVDQGILKNAWKYVEIGGTTSSSAIAKVVNDAPHAGIVEKGARPHMPPLEPILEWVKRHVKNFGLRPPRFGTKMGPLTARATAASNSKFARHLEALDDYEREVLAIAEAIRWKIFKHGQKGTHFVEHSLEELRALVDVEVNRVLARAIAAQGD